MPRAKGLTWINRGIALRSIVLMAPGHARRDSLDVGTPDSASARRSRLMPELPTIAEAGVPGFEAMTWYGALTTGGTPKEFADHIQREIPKWAKVIKDAGIRLE